MAEATDGDNWLLNGRTFDEQHFSPLKEITDKNVSGLGLAWYLDIDSGMGIVSEPIVVDGVAYVSAPLSIVYAVDAASGKLLWKFDPKIRLDLAINGSYSARTNGGVAVWNGKVYVGTGDCRLHRDRCCVGKTALGSRRLRRHSDRNHRRTSRRQRKNIDGLQRLRRRRAGIAGRLRR